jgi:hypothetical protein
VSVALTRLLSQTGRLHRIVTPRIVAQFNHG